jgi:hypothetical protein
MAFLRCRANEIPDVGDPFDVKEFIATLPPADDNPAGTLFQTALVDLTEHRKKVAEQLGWPKDPKSLAIIERQKEVVGKSVDHAYDSILRSTLQEGWTENKDFDRWLNEIFKGEWVGEVQKAIQIPGGIVENPRFMTLSSPHGQIYDNCRSTSNLFAARALQLQARGDSRNALEQLETVLAASRLVKNNAESILFVVGTGMEWRALTQYGDWLEKAGPNKDLLSAGLTVVQQHEAANPSVLNNIKANYLILINSYPLLLQEQNDSSSRLLGHELKIAATQFPWENERLDRIFHAVIATELGFPLKNGARIDIEGFTQEGVLDVDALATRGILVPYQLSAVMLAGSNSSTFRSIPARNQRLLNAVKIVAAMGLYQADHHKAPARVDDLVPNYLPSLPNDPVSGRPFDFRVSKGEKIERASGETPLALAPGQGVVFTDKIETRPWERKKAPFYLPVPTWVK